MQYIERITKSQAVYLPQISPKPLRASYTEVGTGSPIIFLHGFLSNKHCWEELTNLLKDHHRCISLDLLGFGDSSKPKLRYNVPTVVAFVEEFLRVMAIDCGNHSYDCGNHSYDRPLLVGHSFGAWVAAATALRALENSNILDTQDAPETLQIAGLVLIGAAGIRDDSFCGKYDQYRPLLWSTPVVDWVLALATPLAKLLKQQAELDKIRWFRSELMENPAARSFVVDRLRPEDAIDTVEKEIHRLNLPTLVIAGAEDETIPLWHSQTYAQEIQGAKLEIIPKADHSLPQNSPLEIYELIQNFLITSINPQINPQITDSKNNS